MYRFFLLGCAFLVGCARHGPAPVEIKVDDEYKYVDLNRGFKKVPTQKEIPALNLSKDDNKNRKIRSYTVKANETLFDIAYRYDIDPMNLAALNGIDPPYDIKIGQVLIFPDENLVKEDVNPVITPAYNLKTEEVLYAPKPYKSESSISKTEKNSDEVAFLSSPKIKEPKGIKEEPLGISSKTTTNAQVSTSSKKSEFIRPVNGEIVSKFGQLKDGIANEGINIKAPLKTPVKVVKSGQVLYVGNKLEEYGNVVIIKHDSNLITTYAHLNDISVKKDAFVKAGDIIGHVGKTGDINTPQLHFEVMKDKVPVNPANYL